MKVINYKKEYYEQVNNIFEKSFPIEERYKTLNELIKSPNTQLYCLIDNDNVIGFIYLIIYEDMIFILYLAIDNNYRSKGCGSFLLKWCLENYSDKTIYLNIEEVDTHFKDYKTRKKRLDFYHKNGFYLTKYLSEEEKIKFNILSNKLEINLNRYKLLDKKIAEVLDEPASNIVEIYT